MFFPLGKKGGNCQIQYIIYPSNKNKKENRGKKERENDNYNGCNLALLVH